MERHGLRDDQFVRIEHLLPGRPGTVGRNSDLGNRLFVDAGHARNLALHLGQKNGLRRRLRPGRDWSESLPSCLTCHEQPSLGRRHPVKPVSRRSRAREQREA
jgi:hypothetical protein